MNLPTTPEGWAIHLTKLVKLYHEAHGLDRFPINVAAIATDYSRQVFPEAPITMVEGLVMSKNFEGMLIPHPDGNGEWGIVYNKSISSKGRINFTLAHELGHYLLHRTLSPEGLQCSNRSMLDWKSERGQIEAQANTFASYLLMPLDDLRAQIRGEPITMDLMRHLSDRYEVSITAAILKCLGVADKRAMIVIGTNGFIDWAWSSDSLIKSGVFYRARQQVTPLPEQSLAARQDMSLDNEAGATHPKGVWLGDEEVREMTVFSPRNEMSISLLIYPNDAPDRRWNDDLDEPEEWDTYDQFMGHEQSAQLRR
ncbi:MAG: ImmA/IrrE family metallo-endopeptidase [Alphaproteobacteria bacterium]|nr:ImmA/IrrE family metallo-endopeptidase [Alphaproteobacteria bacterium]